jgi:hypothetical protein
MRLVSAAGGQAGLKRGFHNSEVAGLADRERKPVVFKVKL